MRILVTGGAGFIGSHIVDALVERGHSVAVLDNLCSGCRENVNPKARFYHVDVTSADLNEVMDKEKPEVVFHEAAQMDVKKSVADPMFDARVNIIGGLNLYENCVRLNVKKIIFASSGGTVYGEQDLLPTPEDAIPRPLSPYGISKLANEHYLSFYSRTYPIAAISLRYANVYGPRQNPHGEAGVIAIFVGKLLRGETPVINATGKQTRDYVYVDDVVAINMAVLECEKSDAFNVGTGQQTDVNRLYEMIRLALKSDVLAVHGPAKAAEQMHSALDCDKARRVLNWSAKVTLEEGLSRTVAWLRSHARQ